MSLSSLGLRLVPAYTVKAVTGGFAPKPSSIRQDQVLGTGTFVGTGTGEEPVEGNDGGAGETTASERQEQQEYFDTVEFAGAYSPDKEYPETLAGYLEKGIDYAIAPHVEFNSLTQDYRAVSPGGIIEAAMGPISGVMTAAAALSQANLENIKDATDLGTPGYGIGLVNNQIVGVSPNPISTNVFGMSPTDAAVLSGVVTDAPPGVTQETYEAAIKGALLDAAVPATPPGIGPATTGIPDVTPDINTELYGSPDGADLAANVTNQVFSYDVNPIDPELGFTKTPVMTQEQLPVTSGGFLSSDFGFDPDFGYDPYDSTNPNVAVDMFDDPSDFDNNDDPAGTESGPGGYGRGGEEPDGDGGGGSEGAGGAAGSEGDGYGGGDAMGGRIGMRNGGEASPQRGFVNKNPRTVSDSQGIADNRFTSVPQGSFVMNQPANEKYKDDLDVVLGDAEKRAGKARKNASMVDVALSDGERLIRPEVVNFIEKKYGGGFLDNINNTGKPEVKRRQVKYGAKI